MNEQKIKNISNRVKVLSPEIYKDEIHVSRPFMVLSNTLLSKQEEILEKYKLTESELDVLSALFYCPEDSLLKTPTQLRELMFFSSGGMTKLLKKLEAKKYIVRINNEKDKRVKSVQITDLGKEIISKALKDIIEFESQYFSKLETKEQEQLENILYKMMN